MNIKNIRQEKISAFADGELADGQLDSVLAALRGRNERADWDIYHQIGDALRSDDLAFDLSPGFSARLAARLEQEPTILALTHVETQAALRTSLLEHGVSSGANAHRSLGKKFLFASTAAAAVAAIAFVTAPPLLVALNGKESGDNSAIATAAIQNQRSLNGAIANTSSSAPAQASTMAAAQDGQMLRDVRIDEYLAAHQRFSPSVYSTAQYARSAAFVGDSEK